MTTFLVRQKWFPTPRGYLDEYRQPILGHEGDFHELLLSIQKLWVVWKLSSLVPRHLWKQTTISRILILAQLFLPASKFLWSKTAGDRFCKLWKISQFHAAPTCSWYKNVPKLFILRDRKVFHFKNFNNFYLKNETK